MLAFSDCHCIIVFGKVFNIEVVECRSQFPLRNCRSVIERVIDVAVDRRSFQPTRTLLDFLTNALAYEVSPHFECCK